MKVLTYHIGYTLKIKINQSRNCIFAQSGYLIKWKFGLTDTASSQSFYSIHLESISGCKMGTLARKGFIIDKWCGY